MFLLSIRVRDKDGFEVCAMDPGGMINEAGTYNLAEIWPFPINGGANVHSSMRSGVSFDGPNLVHHQFAGSNLISGDPARMSHALSQAVVAGISGARKRRDAAEDKLVSAGDGNDAVWFAFPLQRFFLVLFEFFSLHLTDL